MIDSTVYLATEEVARRAGVYDTAYVVADGRFVVDRQDIRHIRLTGEEYITGITGIEQVSEEQAELLISENRYRRAADMEPRLTETPAGGGSPEDGTEQEDSGSSSSSEDMTSDSSDGASPEAMEEESDSSSSSSDGSPSEAGETDSSNEQ